MRNIILALSCIFAIGSCLEECLKIGYNVCSYCNIIKFHVLCVHPEKGRFCPEPFTEIIPNEDQQREILDWHNRMRQRVALGIEVRGIVRPQPPAANMMKMEWDPELARIAQRSANQCMFRHDCKECRQVLGGRFLVGQNIGLERTYPPYNSSTDFLTTLKQFYDKEVNFFHPTFIDNYEHTRLYGRYSQLVWWNARSVGCGAARFRSPEGIKFSDFLVFCNYGAEGNFLAKKVYLKGNACSRCPQGTHCDSQYYGLCAISMPFNVQDEFPTDKMHL